MAETTTRPLSADRLRTLAGAADAEADDMAEMHEVGPDYAALRDDAREMHALADVLAALTPEAVAALGRDVAFAARYRASLVPGQRPAGEALSRSGLAALARLHPTPRPATHEAPRG